ncbi:MAG: Dyp-type peroxidase [Gammaproteobacteria bacterium]|nr:Dyp-type peroxidase [Gammaproteobacteria bacterium]
MDTTQSGILADLPAFSRYLTFSLQSSDELDQCLRELANMVDGENLVIGLGLSLVLELNSDIEGLRQFPAMTTKGLDIPSTPTALWCWIRGSDRGEMFHQSRLLELLLEPTFQLMDCIDSFKFDQNRDLSGYEDGTENPQGDEAISTALVHNRGTGLDGSSFVAVQKWSHDFDTFDAMSTETQDNVIGRHVSDNEEFDEAPESAHVKRSAQENFDPEAFMLRRSMPWAEGLSGGLNFVAFGKTFDAFEAVLNRMSGKEDGIPDALFSFTRPLTGSYFWCPPMKDGALDLSAIKLKI